MASAPLPLTAEQRKLRAQIAIHARFARGRPEPVPEEVPRLFEDEVDPDRVLHPTERARRAGHAWRAHLARLEFQASRAESRAAAS